MVTTYTPRSESINGSDLSGSDGTANRTYTLTYSTVSHDSVQIVVNGTSLHKGSGLDFTIAGQVITFLNIVDNSDVINIYYESFNASATSASSSTYATNLELAECLGVRMDVPSYSIGSTPAREEVGTGDNSTTVFYLDNGSVISDSYTLYTGGATEATATTEMTETTHYTLDTDKRKVTLTAAGVTLVGTNKIYAEYSYYRVAIRDSTITDSLAQAQRLVDDKLNTSFTDGTATNPQYPTAIDIQDSQGMFNRRYLTYKNPLIDVESTLASGIAADDTSLTVASGDGDKFPPTGTIVIGTEVITYTSVSTDTISGLTRGANGSTAAAHSSGDAVHTTAVQISNTEHGSTPVWTTLQHDSEVFVGEDGITYVYDTSWTVSQTSLYDDQDVPQRYRIYYLYGYDEIPARIKRLTLLFAKRQLLTNTIMGTLFQGSDEFNPSLLNADEIEIERIMGKYIHFDMENV